MELPNKYVKAVKRGPITIEKRNFSLIKEYPNYGLYVDEYGNRECFDRFDLGLVPVRNKYRKDEK